MLGAEPWHGGHPEAFFPVFLAAASSGSCMAYASTWRSCLHNVTCARFDTQVLEGHSPRAAVQQ